MLAILLTLKAYWKEIAIGVLLAGSFYLGYEMKSNKDRADSAELLVAQKQAAIEQTNKARSADEAFAITQTEVDAKYQQGIEDGKNELSAANTKLSNTIRVREQQLAEARRIAGLSNTSTTVSVDNGEASARFLKAWGGDIQQLLADADRNTKQLGACQEQLNNYYLINSGK